MKECHEQAKEITEEWYGDLMQLVETHESDMELMMHPEDEQYGDDYVHRRQLIS